MRRKSTAEKRAIGTYRPGRDRATPKFETDKPIRPPAYLRKNKLALAEWRTVAPYLEAERILRPTDVSLLASYCILYARWREAAQDVEERGQTLIVTATTRTGASERPIVNPSVRNEILYQSAMMKVAIKFGLNPLDRPRVEAGPFDDEEALEDDSDDSTLFDVEIR